MLTLASHRLGAMLLPDGYTRPDPGSPPWGIYVAFLTEDVPAAFAPVAATTGSTHARFSNAKLNTTKREVQRKTLRPIGKKVTKRVMVHTPPSSAWMESSPAPRVI